MRFVLLGAVLGALLSGCGEAEEAAGAGIDVQLESGRKAAESVGKALMEREIRAFRNEHARLPNSLDEVCEDRGMRVPALPLHGRWEYDPATGTVSATFD